MGLIKGDTRSVDYSSSRLRSLFELPASGGEGCFLDAKPTCQLGLGTLSLQIMFNLLSQ